jgi:outer membrane protein insertion porin family
VPASNFLPARYDNFVWWTPDDIATELHRRHPLFTTLVPQSGTMQDALIADLTSMLAAKGVTATVNATPGASVPNSMAVDCVHFAVASPPVHVRTIQFTDLSPELVAKLEGVRNANQGQDYLESDTPAAVKLSATDAIQDEGYLDVTVDNFHRSAPVVEPAQVSVDLSLSVHPGERYRIAQVDWPGSTLLSPADFKKLSRLKVGEAPSITALRQTRMSLANAYTLHGYMAAKTNIEPKKDTAARLVSYIVTVTPGVQYAFHSMTLTGVNDQQREDFMHAWKMQTGMPYNGAYILTFLHDNSGVLRSLDGYSLQWKQMVNDNNHTVDVQLTLKKGGPLQ